MRVETGPEFGKKVEKKENEEIKEQIRSHLDYREKIEKSVLDSAGERLGPSPEPFELEMHRKLENFNDEWYREANRQSENLERGKQIHSVLDLPTRKEEQAEKELDIFSKLSARREEPGKDTEEYKEYKDMEEYIENQKKILKGMIKFCRGTREDWIKKLEGSPKKEKSKLGKKLEELEKRKENK